MIRISWLIALALLAGGCRRNEPAHEGDVRYRGNNPALTYVSDADPEYRKATREAQRSLSEFIGALYAPQPAQTGFAIKVLQHEGNRSEGVWLTNLQFDGRHFHGTVSNDPVNLRMLRSGNRLLVDPEKVADWMYVDNGHLRGGYTLRLVRASMTNEERVRFEESMPFRFE